MSNGKYHVLGLMSGSSLDGLDLAYCKMDTTNNQIEWDLIWGTTLPYSELWTNRLKKLPEANAFDFCKTHVEFGHYMGSLIKPILEDKQQFPDFIASHGHTIFHNPSEGFTVQIGEGAALAATTACTVISDFRTKDIALGGLGTPLAPLADRFLFPGHEFYLNLGGIANITYAGTHELVAFDICAANQILNYLANQIQLPYDHNGEIAKSGQIIPEILNALNTMDFFHQAFPKSLDNNWIRRKILPLFDFNNHSISDLLRTAIEHITDCISREVHQIIKQYSLSLSSRILLSGGGTFNQFLIEILKSKLIHVHLDIPSHQIINYKEAILMAALGIFRVEERANCFQSVTGAKRDNVGGCIYLNK